MSDLKNFERMFRLDGKVALVTGGEGRHRKLETGPCLPTCARI
jgi:hypothetical protein